MSQHPSLRFDSVGAKHRNVLKRLERIKKLQDENKWEGRSSIYGLPKIKSLKIKVKKVKEVKEETAAAQTPAAPSGETQKAAAQSSGGAEKGTKSKS
jgi:small basic protein (TIGR04137 family)